MDPKYLALLDQASTANPAVAQIQQRLDIITHNWFLLLQAIVKRANVLEEDPSEPRTFAVDHILMAIENVKSATLIQGRIQADVFRATGRIWAQQAYSLRLAQALGEAARPLGVAPTKRIGDRMRLAMLRRGLITESSQLPELMPPADSGLTEDMELAAHQFRARNEAELNLLEALAQSGKQTDYVALVERMQDKVFSLWPLLRIIDNMIAIETASDAPLTVILKLSKARNRVAEAQAALDRSLDIKFTTRQAEAVSQGVVDAVIEALESERPAVQQEVLGRFIDLKDTVQMPTRADGAVQVVMDVVKDAGR